MEVVWGTVQICENFRRDRAFELHLIGLIHNNIALG